MINIIFVILCKSNFISVRERILILFLMSCSRSSENIPPLKKGKEWAKTPTDKATLLADTFAAKARLPEVVSNEFSELKPCEVSLDRFLRIRVRKVAKILRDLDETSATGPDGLPAIALRRCAAELALPIALLARLCLNSGCWPSCWRTHWVHPLHKKKSKADPMNYRGVHLTPQIAKVVERSVGSVFVPWLSAHGFGEHQYAYPMWS